MPQTTLHSILGRVGTLLGDGHQYKVVTVAPDRDSPFLSEDTVNKAQSEVEREYESVAEEAAEPVDAPAQVRTGNTAAEAIADAWEEHADIVAMEAPRAGLWGRLTGLGPVDEFLTDAPGAILLVPRASGG